ncbi:hypothetical protein glysoja_044601 [Glycine soja]|uniref:Uncharacterized protein n=1 Tax=Glycine soja TaxID=3848 RepID=A0A0B2QUB6_GLYSO|nr:hypothetical protein glysoja_044601 [Glycine soja]
MEKSEECFWNLEEEFEFLKTCSYSHRAVLISLLPKSSNLCVRNGSYEANRKEVHQRKSFEKATCHESSTQVRSGDRRREEAAPFQAKYGGAKGDPKVPKEHRASHKEASFPKTRKGNRSGLQDQSLLPQQRRLHSPRSRRGLPRCALRGHQPLHHSPKRVTIMPKD